MAESDLYFARHLAMLQPPPREAQTGEALFLAELPLIERVIGWVSRRHRLSADAAEEFGSVARLKLLEDDYAVLRQFEGRSSLQTYLTVVIQRLFLDSRTASWGRWRPSAEAKRLGPLAVQLERLQTRDRLTFDEACETLCATHGTQVSRQDLYDISTKLPARTMRRFEGEESLPEVTVKGDAEGLAEAEHHRALARRIERAINDAITALAPQDRLVLRLRFSDGLSVADIARSLRLDQKPLYRRLDRLRGDLRQRLEAAGLRQDEVRDALAQSTLDISFNTWTGETATAGPSMTSGASR